MAHSLPAERLLHVLLFEPAASCPLLNSRAGHIGLRDCRDQSVVAYVVGGPSARQNDPANGPKLGRGSGSPSGG